MVRENLFHPKGLHDAEIIDIIKEDFDYDYKQKNPIRNMLEIVIDARQAINDTLVKSIRFFNYKIIAWDNDIVHTWWDQDELTEINGRKKLKIITQHPKNKLCEIVILFDKFEIVR